MTKVYVVISTRYFNWGDDRRDMIFYTEEAAEIAAGKVRAKFVDENVNGDVKIMTRVVNTTSAAEDDELVHCILH